MGFKGQVISGSFGEILIRQKSDCEIEIGEILVSESKKKKSLLQVYDLVFSSQISKQNLELISGLSLEEDEKLEFFEPHLRNYTLALAKNMLSLKDEKISISKSLPGFFSNVREVRKEDLSFLSTPKNPLFFGKLRSGSKTLDVDVFLDGIDVFSHHVLIPATTGRGKSNLTSNILFSCVDKDYVGTLVLDPHDEYYGRNGLGLKDHPRKERVIYYTFEAPPVGARTLKINLEQVRPTHFNGVLDWSTPQKDAISAYHKAYGDKWVEAVILEKPLKTEFNEATISVVKRRITNLLDLEYTGSELICNGVFDFSSGKTTINDICDKLEESCTVIIDTSCFSGSLEILIGSLVTTEVFNRYKRYKTKGLLKDKPVISIVIEEAPRVLGREVLEKGSNIFSTIAREGRKFRVGLLAITQLPSLIPRQILANMNTKIILGIEMAPERAAIIESASQDLSSDNRAIASLDRGEAIITSNFSRFATPIKTPLFSKLVEELKKTKNNKEENTKKNYFGIKGAD
ncbi:ATP-binding protein [Candidatus Woesearchaeota archaeon]|nr:ATP-binding protein [Candidatus Woesearchaeota archaeon]